MIVAEDQFYSLDNWFRPGNGARYLQLSRYLEAAIDDGTLGPGSQLPPERNIAEQADISRVTVRKALAKLVEDGRVEQRHGAGSFVKGDVTRHEQSLSSLVSFTENLARRGHSSSSITLEAELVPPSAAQLLSLGLPGHQRIARLKRLRSADGIPMAIETSIIPADILADPTVVTTSLYAVLRARGVAPTRAIQRVTAANLGPDDAMHLTVAPGDAALLIERTAYLDSGRPIEFTRGLYRPDMYDFVSELRLEETQ
jgi:GntR family transcriptional regulator